MNRENTDLKSCDLLQYTCVQCAASTILMFTGLRRYRGRMSFLPVGKYQPPPVKSKLLKRSKSEYPPLDDFVKVTAVKRAHSMIAEGQGQEAPKLLEEANTGGAAADAITEEGAAEARPEFGLAAEEDLAKTLAEHVTIDDTPPAVPPAGGAAAMYRPDLPLLVPLSEPVPEHWQTIEADFVSVLVVHLSHLGPDLIVDPDIRLDEGCMHLIMLHHHATRAQILKLFMQLAEGKANYEDNPAVEMVPITAFRLEPLTEKGVIAVDGEVVDYGPIQGQILPKIANVMGIEKRGERASAVV